MIPEESLQIILDRLEERGVDVILRKERSFSREEFGRRRRVEFLGRPRWLATAEDVLLAKLEWARMGSSERQFEDAVNIGRVQGDSLDRDYLVKWAKSLGVDDLLGRLLSEIAGEQKL